MTEQDVLQYRLMSQHLSSNHFDSAAQAVACMGAVQAQDFSGAKWALAQRSRNLTNSAIDDAYNKGEILRTHILRPTWHFVTPQDIRWMLALTAPRVNVATSYYYREFNLDDVFFEKSNAVIAMAVRNGNYKTRKELNAILEEHGMGGSPQRLGLIIMRAELDAIICSGPMRGKQFTYALLDERAPHLPSLSTDEACAHLAERYFKSHGPATLKDFVWWSGLTTKDARRGIEAADYLTGEVVRDKTYWFDATLMKTSSMIDDMFLLQNYDEYIVSYNDRSILFDPRHIALLGPRTNPLFYNCMIFHGKIVGTWRQTIKAREVIVSWQLFNSSSTQIQAAHSAFKNYEAFIEMPVRYSELEYQTDK
jgi:hypothetical protein